MLLYFHFIEILACSFSFLVATNVGLYSLFQIGESKYPFPFESVAGANGVVYVTPKDLKLHTKLIYTNNPNPIPKNPAINPSSTKANLKYLNQELQMKKYQS